MIEVSVNVRNDGELFLSFNKGSFCEKNIKFDFEKGMVNYSNDVSSVAYDLLIIATVVYNTDRIISRNKFSEEGWTRDIVVKNIPTNNYNQILDIKDELDQLLSFLTGDIWNLNFIANARQDELFVIEESDTNDTESDIDAICLFSGGMDSLIGAIDLLETGKNIILSSHWEMGTVKNDQNRLLVKLREMYPDNLRDNYQLHVCLGRIQSNNIEFETTFRSRSFLFLAQGIYLAKNTGSNVELIVPENGTISINLPLNSSRRSACSTRTTHPHFIKKFNELLRSLGLLNVVKNPYEFKTKGEMIQECENIEFLQSIITTSNSCAKGGHSRAWDRSKDNRVGRNHCGMCMPCLYRRAALYYNGFDTEPDKKYGTDTLSPMRFNINDCKQKRSNDLRAMCNFIKNIPDKKKIEKQMIINGLSDLERISDYSDLIIRSYAQVKTWLISNLNQGIIEKL